VIDSLAAGAALLLVVSGAAKIHSPAAAAAMLARAWPWLRRAHPLTTAVRVGGAVETSIGLAMLAHGGRVAAGLLACCYLVFTVVAVRLTHMGGGAPCGCFGRADSPVGRAHIVLDTACLAVAVVATVRPSGTIAGLFDHGALIGAVGVTQVMLLASLGYLSITALPALAADRRRLMEAR
jgi:hypothetical protein